MTEWQSIDSAPDMTALLLRHEYYSHGQIRHGYRNLEGDWFGVNANGTEARLNFRPTLWLPIPPLRAGMGEGM